jgi:hypothetical protein
VTLVGGLPWEEHDAPGEGVVPGLVVASTTSQGARTPTFGPNGPNPQRGVAGRIEEVVRRSPPFTVSLSLHVLVLLALAWWIVRARREDRVVLDVSFLSTEVVESPDHGVQIVPEPAPVPEPVPEKVESKDSPVDEPIAAPREVMDPVDAPGAAMAAIVAPTIGALLNGREEGRRQALVDAFGGSNATEAAVARALEWLAKQQDKKDDLWSLQGPYVDGGSQENRLAATAMALLAFQGAGNTPHAGKHRRVVERAWKALAKRQQGDGRFDVEPAIPFMHEMYSHAQATIAACELYGMTKDEQYGEIARRATEYAVRVQSPGGGWKYTPGKDGDMSVTGWFVMAIKSAEMAGLAVPAATFEGVNRFLDSVAIQGGVRYGYMRYADGQAPSSETLAVSAEGLLARQYLGWRRDDPRLVTGLDRLLAESIPAVASWGDGSEQYAEKDVYAWYYITQVSHHAGGDAWRRWNERMKEVLPKEQIQKGPEAGSWDPALDRWGHIGGRLFMTCFCTSMLEVYYRHLPLYGDAALAAAPDAGVDHHR